MESMNVLHVHSLHVDGRMVVWYVQIRVLQIKVKIWTQYKQIQTLVCYLIN